MKKQWQIKDFIFIWLSHRVFNVFCCLYTINNDFVSYIYKY